MKTNYFYIHSKLPNLNEFRAEIARSPYKGGKLKAEVGVEHISYRYNEYEMDDTHEFKVIGNIYDNPNLLKE